MTWTQTATMTTQRAKASWKMPTLASSARQARPVMAAYRGDTSVEDHHHITFWRRATRRHHTVLVSQRMHLETSQPEFAISADADKLLPVGMSLEEARRQVDEAYEQMDVHVKALVDSLDRVRRAEHIGTCATYSRHAAGRQPPSTSWAVDEVVHAPFPRIASALKDIFLAGRTS